MDKLIVYCLGFSILILSFVFRLMKRQIISSLWTCHNLVGHTIGESIPGRKTNMAPVLLQLSIRKIIHEYERKISLALNISAWCNVLAAFTFLIIVELELFELTYRYVVILFLIICVISLLALFIAVNKYSEYENNILKLASEYEIVKT